MKPDIETDIIPSLLMPYRTPDGHTGYYNSFALPDIQYVLTYLVSLT